MTTYADIARNASADAIAALLNGGTIELQSSTSVVIATIAAPTPAFGAAAAGVATANTLPQATITTSGTVAKGVAKNSAGAVVFTATATLTAGAGPIKLSRLDFVSGEAVQLTSLTLTAPAEG